MNTKFYKATTIYLSSGRYAKGIVIIFPETLLTKCVIKKFSDYYEIVCVEGHFDNNRAWQVALDTPWIKLLENDSN